MERTLGDWKKAHLEAAKQKREAYFTNPELKQLFFEFTLRCNEHCFHCGSRCDDSERPEEMQLDEWKAIIDEVAENFPKKPMLCITGGEPLIYEDFFPVMEYAYEKGFKWGMTSNATLIDKKTAQRLKDVGMRTISVSIDGLPETHDRQRGLPGGYKFAMDGIRNLAEVGFDHLQVTTVLNHETLHEREALFEIMKELPIDSWRLIHLEPIGRALEHPEKMMTKEDYRIFFDYIYEKRREQYPVCYGCSHYLGLGFERELRNWWFICSAGRTVASIMSNGDIGACLDIDRTPESIQGNVRRDSFTDVWKNRFSFFRQELSNHMPECKGCPSIDYCGGGACHSFDFNSRKQQICFKDVLQGF